MEIVFSVGTDQRLYNEDSRPAELELRVSSRRQWKMIEKKWQLRVS
jgi:hypothetical protein